MFYEAIWFDYDELYEFTPIVRGYDVNMRVDKLLRITKDQSRSVKVYKFTYNNNGHNIELHARFDVFNELELFIE